MICILFMFPILLILGLSTIYTLKVCELVLVEFEKTNILSQCHTGCCNHRSQITTCQGSSLVCHESHSQVSTVTSQ